MKTLRYLLMVIVVALVSVTAQAQPKAEFKNSQNQAAFSTQYVPTTHYVANTTSALMESGSSLPMAARNGLTIGANTPDDNTSLGLIPRPRRAASPEDEGDTPPSDPEGPQENPIGDGVWVLLILAVGYAWYRKWREWRKMTCFQS